MKPKTTYEHLQIERMVNHLLTKDKWNKTFVRKNLNKDGNNLFKNYGISQ